MRAPARRKKAEEIKSEGQKEVRGGKTSRRDAHVSSDLRALLYFVVLLYFGLFMILFKE